MKLLTSCLTQTARGTAGGVAGIAKDSEGYIEAKPAQDSGAFALAGEGVTVRSGVHSAVPIAGPCPLALVSW